MRTAGLLVICALALSACGGTGTPKRSLGATSVSFASGPISSACLKAGRKSANRNLCGCIQGVANRDLSSADQRLAATFFRDPHRAQVIRQSDRASHEVFWKKYKAFAARAEGTCRGF